jgi:Mg-chelatase subunit ChlD
MGRGEATIQQQATLRSSSASAPRFERITPPRVLPEIAAIVGTETHRQLVERSIRSRTGTIERVEFSPGEGSKTDMHGRIWVDSAAPYDGALPEETAICINGRARHELLHPMHTDRHVFDAFVREELPRVRESQGADVAQRLMFLWNCVEDGQIETREMRNYPGSYHWIAAMNEIDPRVGRSQVVEHEIQLPWANDWQPEDADGNPFPIADGFVTIPAGARLSPWTEKPLSLSEQASSAVLAEAVPGFQPAALHPRVQSFLDEARPYIDAARESDSAECVRCAYALHALLEKHDLLPEVVEQNGGLNVAGPTGEASGSMSPVSAPEGMDFVPEDGQPGASAGGSPAKMPPQPGEPAQSEQLQDALAGSGTAAEEAEDASDAAGENDGGNPAEGDKQPAQAQGSSAEANGGEASSESDASNGGGDNPTKPGGQASSEVERAKQKAREELEGAAAREAARAAKNQEKRWKGTSGDKIVSASELRSQGAGGGRGNADVEQITSDRQLVRLGHKLAAEFERLKEIADQDTRYLRTGSLDRRRMTAAVAGNPHVMKRSAVPSRLDVAVEVVLDRSGSTQSDTANHFRMAAMFAEAAKKVPGLGVGIWGFDGGGQQANHYEYLTAGSEDQRSLKSIFTTGGGGTPTPNAIEFARARLREQPAAHKLLVVVTDGIANGADGVEKSREQVEWAQRDGLKVVGFGFDCDDAKMREQFGAAYRPIDDYTQVPKIAGRLITKLLGKTR